MKFLKWLGIVVILLAGIYLLGPRPSRPAYATALPVVPAGAADLEVYIKETEAKHQLKPDNEARIIWYNDSLKQPTEYAVVYLHGFSASQEEGDPVHINFAKKFGCNLFLSRLDAHGIDTTEPMASFTAEGAWKSAKEALAIARQLGKKIIVMGTSTGGTLALKLAATYPDIAGLLLLSPNIEINDGAAWLLNNPWGLEIAHMVVGKYNTAKDTTAIYKQYWYNRYRMEAAVQLQELLETSMKASVFEKVKQPVLLLYYFKDDDHQDDVVKVSAMKRMFLQLGTPDSLKTAIAVPEAADHVIGSYIKSKDIATVEKECEQFAKNVLRMNYTKTDTLSRY